MLKTLTVLTLLASLPAKAQLYRATAELASNLWFGDCSKPENTLLKGID